MVHLGIGYPKVYGFEYKQVMVSKNWAGKPIIGNMFCVLENITYSNPFKARRPGHVPAFGSVAKEPARYWSVHRTALPQSPQATGPSVGQRRDR